MIRLVYREKYSAWVWVAIAFMVASVRAFETGTSLDPALFASIARNFSQDWNWWSMRATDTLFPVFFEHPFLGIWLQGILFSIFGADDTTTRFLGLIFGPLTFFYLYRIGEYLIDRKYAAILCFITLFSVYFTGRMATFYFEMPLTFFYMGSIYFYLRMKDSPTTFGVWSGIFLGLAFWTKGLAVLPIVALLALIGLYRYKLRALWSVHCWLPFVVAAGMIVLFVVLQSTYGSYNFFDLYIKKTFFRQVMGPNMTVYAVKPFLMWLMRTHALHTILALFAIGLVAKKSYRTYCFPVFIGISGAVLLILATLTTGKYYLHYYYPIYPLINIAAAVVLYVWLGKYEWIDKLAQTAFLIGFAYLILWQLFSFPMRRKVPSDFYELIGPVEAMKKQGLERIDGLGIAFSDWGFRDITVWYWGVDTIPDVQLDSLKNPVLVEPSGFVEDKELIKRGYTKCRQVTKYTLWVKDPALLTACQTATMPKRFLR